MSKKQKILIFILRVTSGWLFFWAGITKVLNPDWSAADYLMGAKTFPWFYHWLASPNLIPIVNFLNQWGLTLLGLSLIFGLALRWSSILGAVLMFLYYLAALDFPYPNPHSFIIDEHIIYALILLLLANLHAGQIWGLTKKDNSLENLKANGRN